MTKQTFLLIALVALYSACHNNKHSLENEQTTTSEQQEMLDNGWERSTPSEEMSEEYGIRPVYGMQDNYFDIVMGEGADLAVKIMDVQTHQCIRYVYVPECSTVTVQEIPQGAYYLKIAYGKDWMKKDTDSTVVGKFTRDAFYERSRDIFDFGTKNAREKVDYRLEINLVGSKLENNFRTMPISETEFME